MKSRSSLNFAFSSLSSLYQSPTIEIQEILVEKGFAGSYSPGGGGSSSSGIEGGLGGSEGMGGGGDINIGW